MNGVLTIEQRNKRRLVKIHKLISQSKIVWNNHKAFPKFWSRFLKNHIGNQFTILYLLNISNHMRKDFTNLDLLYILNGGVNG